MLWWGVSVGVRRRSREAVVAGDSCGGQRWGGLKVLDWGLRPSLLYTLRLWVCVARVGVGVRWSAMRRRGSASVQSPAAASAAAAAPPLPSLPANATTQMCCNDCMPCDAMLCWQLTPQPSAPISSHRVRVLPISAQHQPQAQPTARKQALSGIRGLADRGGREWRLASGVCLASWRGVGSPGRDETLRCRAGR